MSIELKQIVDPGVINDSKQVFPVFKGSEKIIESPIDFTTKGYSRCTLNARTSGDQTFIGRDAKIRYQFTVPYTCVVTGTTTAAPDPIFEQMAPIHYPFQSAVSSYDVVINGKPQRSVALSSILPQYVRLMMEGRMSYLQTCPSNSEVFYDATAAFQYVGSGLGDFSTAVPEYYSGNGSYYNVFFSDKNGKRMGDAPPGGVAAPGGATIANSAVPAGGGAKVATYYNSSGMPCSASAAGAAWVDGTAYTVTMYVTFIGVEPLLVSPFDNQFNRHLHPKSIYGINTFDLTANMDSTAWARLIRVKPGKMYGAGAWRSDADWSCDPTQVTFTSLSLSIMIKKPNLTLGVPEARCLVPNYYYIDQVSSQATDIEAAIGSTAQARSGTISIPLFGERQMIFARVNEYPSDPTIGSWLLPISNLSITWGTQTNEVQSFSPERLYEMTARNGYVVDANLWNGLVYGAQGELVQTVGSAVVTRPSIDYYLGENQYAPGVTATPNYNIVATVVNNTGAIIGASSWSLHIVTFFSDFLEFEGGDVREITTVIKPADVLLPLEDAMSIDTVQSLLRGGGGASQLSAQLSGAFDKMRGIYNRGRDFRTALMGKGEGAGRMTAGSDSSMAARRLLSRHA